MPINVHLGSGDRRLDGYVNVDLYAPADVKADLRDVDFPAESVAEVLCVHAIEHITQAEAVALFRRIARWLVSGGRVVFETPDRKKCLNLLSEQAYLLGAKGLLGGRSHDKAGWHKWLTKWGADPKTEQIVKDINVGSVKIPPQWELSGERHCYCWEGHELARMLDSCGLPAKVGDPKHHGSRAWRDCRVVGVKP